MITCASTLCSAQEQYGMYILHPVTDLLNTQYA